MNIKTNDPYLSYKNALRSDVKLKVCLDEYVRLSMESNTRQERRADLPETAGENQRCEQYEIFGQNKLYKESPQYEQFQEYRGYLSTRRRAAWEVLIQEENLDGLRLFAREGWLSCEDARGCMDLAARMGKRECQLWLLQYIKNPDKACGADKAYQKSVKEDKQPETRGLQADEAGRSVRQEKNTADSPEKNICREIIQVLLQKLQSQIPALASAFPNLTCICIDRGKADEIVWGTDGKKLYYEETELITAFCGGTDSLARLFLHSLFHCLYLHMVFPQENDCWDLACDLAAEWALDESGWYPLEPKRRSVRNAWYREILMGQKGRDTQSCCAWLIGKQREGQLELLEKMRKEFSADSHRYWYEKETLREKASLEDREHMALTWENARQGISMMLCGSGQRAGTQGGGSSAEYRSANKKTYDYRKFLRQFAVCREEMQLDMESIDYIPYCSGLERYGNILLVEPLETTEVSRLEEFVIAIDTSGSCSGEIVCRFLDETYKILSSRENFFRKMNVHIIQCDSVIQDHRKITCEEDWKAYRERVRIQGLGGTDFTPVFRLVDRMIEQKEIRRLKGLLYFTDGDGVFPRRKPSYETAFVFLNRALEKSKIPDWAIRLNLEL